MNRVIHLISLLIRKKYAFQKYQTMVLKMTLKWPEMSLYNPEKEIGEHFQFMGDHAKFPRWITHVVFGESFMNDTSKRLFKLNAPHPSALKLSIALESWRIFSKNGF